MAQNEMESESSLEYSFAGEETLMESAEDNVLCMHIPYKNGQIVLMNHPVSISLYKYVSVKVLSGSVSVFGYDITPSSKPVKVFSSERTGLIQMKTETFEQIWRKADGFENLEKVILEVTDCRKLTTKILSRFGNNTVVVHLQREPFPVNVQCLEFYYPHILEFSFYSKSVREKLCVFPQQKYVPIQFSVDEEKLATEISVLIRKKKLSDAEAPRIIVCGRKNVGKSTLLRFLINKTLSVYPSACYLDTDPGQTEYTPPGVVGITKVNKPNTGPPFINQRQPARMIFTGSTSPSFLEVYSRGVFKLMHMYTEEDAKLKELPLFVNTMGWMESTGEQCLINTITAVKPTVLVEIVLADEPSMFDYREHLPDGSRYFQICRSQKFKPCVHNKEMRDMSLLSHLGRSLLDFMTPVHLNEVTPYCVSWKKMPIFVFPGRNVPRTRLVEAINESIVALCNVPESSIKESSLSEYQLTLEDDPDNVCLAYGFVKAVDELNQLLYIISPLKEIGWKDVNAIIKGNVVVPTGLILEQEIYDVPLPFTNDTRFIPSDDEEDLDISKVSLNISIGEDCEDTPISDLNGHSSVKRLRKPISRRSYKKGKH